MARVHSRGARCWAAALRRTACSLLAALGLCAVGTIDDRVGARPRDPRARRDRRRLRDLGGGARLGAVRRGLDQPGADDGLGGRARQRLQPDGQPRRRHRHGGRRVGRGHRRARRELRARSRSRRSRSRSRGACSAFLRFNLARPARVFLGDGGSMPIGFLLAAMITAIPSTEGFGTAAVFAVVPFVGLIVLDTRSWSSRGCAAARRCCPAGATTRPTGCSSSSAHPGRVALVLGVAPGGAVRARLRPVRLVDRDRVRGVDGVRARWRRRRSPHSSGRTRAEHGGASPPSPQPAGQESGS